MWSNSRKRSALENAQKTKRQLADLPSFGLQRQSVGGGAAG
jgi:hypothetical protein